MIFFIPELAFTQPFIHLGWSSSAVELLLQLFSSARLVNQSIDRKSSTYSLDNQPIEKFQGRIEEMVSDRLLQINTLWQRLIKGDFTLY
ncbi:MAG: hypothetical protein QNJ41_26425 [Xenococcaceae cyanobacterium MO_188.B32]|nr:hypothetical protein [Xenococcaceae cyanobacterium MO_188.B32]